MKLSDSNLRKLVRSELLNEYGLNERGESWNPTKFKIGGVEFEALDRKQEKEIMLAFKKQKRANKARLKEKLKAGDFDKAKMKELLAVADASAEAKAQTFAAGLSAENLDAKAAAAKLLEKSKEELVAVVRAKGAELGIDVDNLVYDEIVVTALGEQIDSEAAESAMADVKSVGTLRRGAKGQRVRDMQKKFQRLAFLFNDKDFALDVDGDYGPATVKAVVKFQKLFNGMNPAVVASDAGVAGPDVKDLVVDGKVGDNTWKAMHWAAHHANSLRDAMDVEPGEPGQGDEVEVEEEEVVKESRRRLSRGGVRGLIQSELLKL